MYLYPGGKIIWFEVGKTHLIGPPLKNTTIYLTKIARKYMYMYMEPSAQERALITALSELLWSRQHHTVS